MTAIDPTALKETIRRAFDGTAYPGDANIAYGTSEDLERQQIAADFRGKSWRDVDLAFVRRYVGADAACLAFMSSDAFRYFLPAFLLITIDEFESIDLVGPSTVHYLTPWHDESDEAMRTYEEQRFGAFTPAQQEAIELFLEYMRDVHRDDLYDVDRALRYWRSRRQSS
jgi:hypothetical protein